VRAFIKDPDDEDDRYRSIFLKAIVLSLVLHGLGIAAYALSQKIEEPPFKVLAVMDFSDYDPFGGQGGDGAMTPEAAGAPEPEPEPEPNSIPEPEPFLEPEPPPEPELVDLTVLESLAELAEPAPILVPPPPEPKAEPKPKAKPKPKERPKPAPTAQAAGQAGDQSGGGAGLGSGGTPGTGGGTLGGTKGGTGTGNPNEMNAYKSKVRQRLERRKKYPPAAQSRGLSGTATVSFVIARNGSVHSSTLVKSSGHQTLDDEAVSLPTRCSPLPALPDSYGGLNLTLTVPIKFSAR
jgi:protein TonB